MKQRHSFEWWCGMWRSVLTVIGIVTGILFMRDITPSLSVGVTSVGISIYGGLLLLVSIKKTSIIWHYLAANTRGSTTAFRRTQTLKGSEVTKWPG